MAKVGGAAAYQQLQVPKDGISQAMQFWGAQGAKKQADKKLADEREGVRKKKEIADWETKFNLKEGDFKNKYTGFKSFDDMNTDFSMYATDQYVDLQRKAKEALLNGDLQGKNKLEGELIRLKNAFGEAAKSQEFFANKFSDYQKAAQEGRVSGASQDFEDIVQEAMVNKNVALRMVDGNLVYTGMKDGKDGTREPFIIPYQDLMDGSFSYYEKQQLRGEGGIVDNILNDLGTITREGANGYFNITTQAWDDQKEDGIHSQSTSSAIDALLGSDEIMGDLLHQYTGESKMFGFTDEEKKQVKDKLTTEVRAGYSEKFGKKFNTGKYAADSRAATARAKSKKDEDSPLSNLHFDAVKFTEGDYTGLLGRHESEFGEEVNIREVVPAPEGDYVIAITDTGDRIEVPNTKRGFLEFKIRGKSEYKGLTPEKVMQTQPTSYREGEIGGAPLTNIANDLFDAEGKPTVDDERFLERLNQTFGIQGEDTFTWSGNSLKINGKNVDTSSKDKFVETMTNALDKKEKIDW